MALNRTAWGGAITETYTATGRFTLGDLREVHDSTHGLQIWRFVYNDEAATSFSVGLVIAQQAAASGLIYHGIINATDQANKYRLLGVAQHTIPAASYGWILVKGRGIGMSEEDIAADVPINCGGTAGRINDDAAVPGAWFGTSHAAVTTGAGVQFTALFDFPLY